MDIDFIFSGFCGLFFLSISMCRNWRKRMYEKYGLPVNGVHRTIDGTLHTHTHARARTRTRMAATKQCTAHKDLI